MKGSLYKHYVDDIFCMFGNEKDAENFFEFLSCRHKNIKFTFEKESNKLLSFLDILIKNEGNRFSTSVYRNKTSLRLFTQFHSFTPISYKIGLLRCLIHRAFKISSSYIIFHNELKKINILPQKNMYPKSVIDNQINIFLHKKFTADSGTTSGKQKTLQYSLPHNGHFSHVTKKKLRHICQRFCKDINIKIAFSPLNLVVFSVVMAGANTSNISSNILVRMLDECWMKIRMLHEIGFCI